MKNKKLFLLFYNDHKEAQFLTASEIEVKLLCDDLKSLGANYIPVQLCAN